MPEAHSFVTPTIDLNADLGEYSVPGDSLPDRELLEIVTSANIACGAHAGNQAVMDEVIAMAAARGVAVGAHPGYPDVQGFGRRELGLTPEEILTEVTSQIEKMLDACAAQHVTLIHVKPHGALYNRAVVDADAADAIAEAIRAADHRLILVGLPRSELLRAGRAASLRVASEAFADRAYLANGTLAPRDLAGSVLTSDEEVAERVERMVTKRTVTAVDGTVVPIEVDTICVHGDNPRAVALALAVRGRLEERGIRIAPLAR
jgi:UPF0271 protein